MVSKKVSVLFSLVILLFIIVLSVMFFEFLHGKIFLLPMVLLGLAGGLLLFFSWKEKSKVRWWLVLTGSSAAGFFVFAFLHNMFYAFAELSTITWLKTVFEVFHAAFFLIGVLAYPLGFIVGVVGSLWLLSRAR